MLILDFFMEKLYVSAQWYMQGNISLYEVFLFLLDKYDLFCKHDISKIIWKFWNIPNPHYPVNYLKMLQFVLV